MAARIRTVSEEPGQAGRLPPTATLDGAADQGDETRCSRAVSAGPRVRREHRVAWGPPARPAGPGCGPGQGARPRRWRRRSPGQRRRGCLNSPSWWRD